MCHILCISIFSCIFLYYNLFITNLYKQKQVIPSSLNATVNNLTVDSIKYNLCGTFKLIMIGEL